MLRLEFENAADAITLWLQSQPHVVLQRVQGTAVDISFSGDRSAQAALVRACVTEGHALVSVASITENLQQSYLKSLAAERATGTTPRMQP